MYTVSEWWESINYQRYFWPPAIDGNGRRAEDVREREGLLAASKELRLYGEMARDYLSCDKHSISGLTIRLSLRRSPNNFVDLSEDAAKDLKVQLVEAIFYLRKMIVTDYVLSSIEKTWLKNPAIFIYIEIVPKTFLLPELYFTAIFIFSISGPDNWYLEQPKIKYLNVEKRQGTTKAFEFILFSKSVYSFVSSTSTW